MKSRSLLLLFVIVAIGVILWLRIRSVPTPTPATATGMEPTVPTSRSGETGKAEVPAPPTSGPTAAPQMPAASPIPTLAAPPGSVPSPGVAPTMAPGAVGSPPTPTPPDTEVDPAQIAQDLDQLALSMRDYRTLMAQNPVGTNAEIAKALQGGNTKGAQLAPEGIRVNGSGELVDRWGTPYFFHQMSATSMEIHSAGPDKRMGTEDDIIQR